MSTAYGKIPKPKTNVSLDTILPIKKMLRNGKEASLQQVDPNNKELVSFLMSLCNHEIIDGSTYPQEEVMDEQGFADYFLSYDSFVLVDGEPIEPGKEYNMKDKGRCSHICNGGFFTSFIHRGNGAGVAMGECFPVVASTLGYKASVFNLVFENNTASVKIWKRLGFQEVGRIPKAGRLNNSPDKLVDAIIFYKDFTSEDQ